MTNKVQSALTIALTAAVLVLVVDRVLASQEEACATEWDVAISADDAASKVIQCLNNGAIANLNDYDGILSGDIEYSCY